eukprot:Gb_22678 [translate_table: standard]
MDSHLSPLTMVLQPCNNSKLPLQRVQRMTEDDRCRRQFSWWRCTKSQQPGQWMSKDNRRTFFAISPLDRREMSV